MKMIRGTVPIAGYIEFEFEVEDDASNEDREIAALEAAGDCLRASEFVNTDRASFVEIEAYTRLVQGNVCYVYHNRIEIEEDDEVTP